MPNIAKPFCEKHQAMKKKNKNGRNICLQCINDNKKKIIALDPEKHKLKNADYYLRIKDRQKDWIANDRMKNPERHRAYAKKYAEKYGEIHSIRKSVRPHGLNENDFFEMLEKCNDKCAICGNEEEVMHKGKKRRLCVDHDHITNKIRDLLCTACNAGIGNFKEDIQRLYSAIDYLKKHKD